MYQTLRLGLLAAPLLAAVACPTLAAEGPPTPPAFPPHLFTQSFFLYDHTPTVVGNGSGPALGVTSLTFSNFAQTTQQVFMFQALTDGHSCSAAVSGGGGVPSNYFLLPPQQTTHLTFPTPLAVPHLAGVSCLAFEVTTDLQGGSVDVLVNGYSQ